MALCELQKTNADGRLVIGTLKGYDQLMNLVLDEVKEAMTGKLYKLWNTFLY